MPQYSQQYPARRTTPAQTVLDPDEMIQPGLFIRRESTFLLALQRRPLAARGETQLERWLGRRSKIRESPPTDDGNAISGLFVETEGTDFKFRGNLLLAAGCRSQRGKKVRLLF